MWGWSLRLLKIPCHEDTPTFWCASNSAPICRRSCVWALSSSSFWSSRSCSLWCGANKNHGTFSHSNGWIFHSYMLVYQRVYGSVDSCQLWWLGNCLEADGQFYMGQIIFMVRKWWIWDEQSLENDWENQNHRENSGGTWWKMLRKCLGNSRERMENGFHHELWENDGRGQRFFSQVVQKNMESTGAPNPGLIPKNCCHLGWFHPGHLVISLALKIRVLQYLMYHDVPSGKHTKNYWKWP